MISKKMQTAFNKQLGEETFSAYLYWQMSAYFETRSLKGYANWMRCQAQEEMVHAMMFYSQILERGGEVALGALKAPDTTWDSPLAIFEAAYKHECYISACIDKLVKLAREAGDNAAENFLQWFVKEQVEEEATADEQRQQLKLAEGSPQALLLLDREAGARVFTPPPAKGGAAG